MPGEITRWLNGTAAVDRRHNRDLDAIERNTELAEARVQGINQVTRRAVYETMLTGLVRQKAEQLAPDSAELYALIAVAGAVASTEVVEGMSRRRCGQWPCVRGNRRSSTCGDVVAANALTGLTQGHWALRAVTVMLEVLGFLVWLLFIGLALFGALVLLALTFGPNETERQRIAREVREAERRITDIGRQAQATILAEALRRVRVKPTTRRTDPMNLPNDGSYVPWDN